MEHVVTDAELLARWADGCARAASELLERHFAVVHRFFRNKAGADLEDLVQQTFLACLEARARFRGHANFKTFLLAIARNQLFTYYSRRRHCTLDVGTDSFVRDVGTTPTGAMARRENERLLAQALQQIPLDFQVILELVFWEGLGAPEIAAVLDVPLNTAYSRLRRAKLSLRAKLAELAPEQDCSIAFAVAT